MHTLSSASRTCMASASAVEWTATVGMPSSLQARSTRSAISPRLAIRILSNIGVGRTACARPSLDDHQRLAEFHRLSVLEQDLADDPGAWRGNLIERLHRLDDQKRVADLHAAADIDERLGAGLGRAVGGADHRRGHHAGMARGIDHAL